MKLLTVLFSTVSYYLVPLRAKYLPQHSILDHPQPTFFPRCEKPSFTPTLYETLGKTMSICFNL